MKFKFKTQRFVRLIRWFWIGNLYSSIVIDWFHFHLQPKKPLFFEYEKWLFNQQVYLSIRQCIFVIDYSLQFAFEDQFELVRKVVRLISIEIVLRKESPIEKYSISFFFLRYDFVISIRLLNPFDQQVIWHYVLDVRTNVRDRHEQIHLLRKPLIFKDDEQQTSIHCETVFSSFVTFFLRTWWSSSNLATLHRKRNWEWKRFVLMNLELFLK